MSEKYLQIELLDGINLTCFDFTLECRLVELGYSTAIIDYQLEGNVKSVSQKIASHLKETLHTNKPTCLLVGGETTVNGKNGKGGRNQELVLSTLMELEETDTKFTFASFGTEETDQSMQPELILTIKLGIKQKS